MTFGATADFGFYVTENPVHIHDLQATILPCLALTTNASPTTTPAATFV